MRSPKPYSGINVPISISMLISDVTSGVLLKGKGLLVIHTKDAYQIACHFHKWCTKGPPLSTAQNIGLLSWPNCISVHYIQLCWAKQVEKEVIHEGGEGRREGEERGEEEGENGMEGWEGRREGESRGMKEGEEV